MILSTSFFFPPELYPGTGELFISLQMTRKMKLTLQNSVFKDSPVVSVSAKPGGSEAVSASSPVGMQFHRRYFLDRGKFEEIFLQFLGPWLDLTTILVISSAYISSTFKLILGKDVYSVRYKT